MSAAQELMNATNPIAKINWQLGDMHKTRFEGKFDVIIGNSFMHHFHDVPEVLARFRELLNPGGVFITQYEPTPMSTVVEGAKMLAWPLAVLAPRLVNEIARACYKGEPSSTDLWMFESAKLKQVAIRTGFESVDIYSWGLFRPFVVQRNSLHLSADKPKPTMPEIKIFRRAVKLDSIFNRVLPNRFFGSISMVCRI